MHQTDRRVQYQHEADEAIHPRIVLLPQRAAHQINCRQHYCGKDAFYEKACGHIAHHGAHQGICFEEAARSQQHRRAEPVGDVQRIDQIQLAEQVVLIGYALRTITSFY